MNSTTQRRRNISAGRPDTPCDHGHDRVPLVLRVATRVNLSYVLRVKSGGEKRGPVFGGVEIGTMEPADHESDRSDDE